VLSRELRWLDNAIHLLDHRKGEAEKRLARIRDEVCGTSEREKKGEKVRKAEKEVGEMEQTHDEYVERLGHLRDKVISEIDKLLLEHTLRREAYRSEAI
jgi:predicted  nucleic acid-binding Zn-ribbon protein